MNIPVSLDMGNILFVITSGMVVFIWRHVTFLIKANCDRIEQQCKQDQDRTNDRLVRLEKAMEATPDKLESLIRHLQKIEVLLADKYATKDDLSKSIEHLEFYLRPGRNRPSGYTRHK